MENKESKRYFIKMYLNNMDIQIKKNKKYLLIAASLFVWSLAASIIHWSVNNWFFAFFFSISTLINIITINRSLEIIRECKRKRKLLLKAKNNL